MSMSVASKNPFDLLGNDIPEDEQPSPPPRNVVKNTPTTKKQDEKPDSSARRRSNRERPTGNEGAFRDPEAGHDSNRSKGTPDAEESSHRRGARGRGSGRGRDFDRHSGTGIEDTDKQVGQGWGSNTGESEWKDEVAGQALAAQEAAAVEETPAQGAEGEAAHVEEEEKTKTYDEYLAELAAKKANLGAPTDIRRPNEGSREDKKWASAKPLQKNEDGTYFIGESKEKTRNRERKTKQVIEIDAPYADSRNRRGGDRGGRGGRGRGDRPRNDYGDRPRNDYGGRYGGGRDNAPASVNINDANAFPALG